jgi:hypothetical protein
MPFALILKEEKTPKINGMRLKHITDAAECRQIRSPSVCSVLVFVPFGEPYHLETWTYGSGEGRWKSACSTSNSLASYPAGDAR